MACRPRRAACLSAPHASLPAASAWSKQQDLLWATLPVKETIGGEHRSLSGKAAQQEFHPGDRNPLAGRKTVPWSLLPHSLHAQAVISSSRPMHTAVKAHKPTCKRFSATAPPARAASALGSCADSRFFLLLVSYEKHAQPAGCNFILSAGHASAGSSKHLPSQCGFCLKQFVIALLYC